MKQGRKHRGFTLVELVVAAGALALLAVMVMTFTGFGNQVLKSGANSYDIQSGIRVASETAVQQIRYASAIFTIPESTFKKGASGLTEDWNYIGVEQTTDENGQAVSQIVNYIAKGVGHEKKVIAQSPPGTTFDISFSQKDPEAMDKLIQLEIVSYLEGQSTPYTTVETEVDALNALQVVDKYPGAKCTAIAYRTDERPTGKQETYAVNVVMVLDASGSMAFNVNNDNTASSVNVARTKYLRDAGADMLEMLSHHSSIYAACVSYSSKAGYSPVGITEFVNVQADKDGANKLGNYFKTYKTSSTRNNDPLYPDGGTNTGDGVRKAYYMLSTQAQKQKDEGITKIKNYMVIMTDGAPTFYSYTGSTSNYYTGDGTSYSVNTGNDTVRGPAYANLIAAKWAGTGAYIPYLVVFATNGNSSDIVNFKQSLQCPEENFSNPVNGDQLKDIFGIIAETIVTETWHLTGPDI